MTAFILKPVYPKLILANPNPKTPCAHDGASTFPLRSEPRRYNHVLPRSALEALSNPGVASLCAQRLERDRDAKGVGCSLDHVSSGKKEDEEGNGRLSTAEVLLPGCTPLSSFEWTVSHAHLVKLRKVVISSRSRFHFQCRVVHRLNHSIVRPLHLGQRCGLKARSSSLT